MRPVTRRFRALPLVLVVVLAACSGSGDDTPTATVPTAVETSTTASPPSDPYAIPAVIDVPYVQRVFDALDQIDGAVFAEFLAKRQLTPEMGMRLGAIYNRDELERQLKSLTDLLAGDLGMFRNRPGTRRTVVKRLITAKPECISVIAEFDNREVLRNPRPPTPTYIALQPTDPALDPTNANPTPYSIFDEDKDFRDSCAVS